LNDLEVVDGVTWVENCIECGDEIL